MHRDRFGNLSHYFEVHYPHTHFSVVKEAIVDVEWPSVDIDQLDQWSLASAQRAITGNAAFRLDRAMYGLPSKHVAIPAELSTFTESILASHLGFGQTLVELTKGIRRDFAYRPGVTSVRTTVAELLDLRAGVCQDFAHLGLAVLRSLGVPARYVSGYLETAPPPGNRSSRVGRVARVDFSIVARRRLDRRGPHQRAVRRLALHRDGVGQGLR